MRKIIISSLYKTPLHILYWGLVWLFFYLFFSVGSSNAQFLFWFTSILSIITIIGSYVFTYNLIPNYLLTKKYWSFLLYTTYAIVFILFGVLVTVVFGFVFFFNLEFQNMPALTKSSSVILVCVFLIIALASGFKILSSNYKSIEEKRALENKFLQTQLQLKEQELKFLKMQIHPHFLFNTLNTLYGFALKKSDQAPDMILKLSNLLDYILYQVDKPLVLLKSEIEHIDDYISLEKMRFQKNLNVRFQKDLYNETVQIPPMLLLPFVENAFKHGTPINGVMNISIHLKTTSKELHFYIENNSNKTTTKRKGIGLENIQKRLEMLYNKKSNLIVTSKENLFMVDLKIPLKND
ncbi:histidine kinase [Tenacibaculum tangerinum]|uniref:Histidine kinase n=1 Tax=Tenacibaculum tangerinum TaxID=3038772 RepID=A0ABY8L4S6_9FLAO|nr:histidine kinase [Tenacibaculum tangerinum]WGH75348.1 histidine kinase [Tenacibaculum tangerinum]